MPTFPKSKSRPWIPKRDKGNAPRSGDISGENMKFYNSKKWRSLRNYFIQMNPLCKSCEDMGYITPGQEVDHIKPIRLGGAECLVSNLQTLCKSCHARKSGREGHIRP